MDYLSNSELIGGGHPTATVQQLSKQTNNSFNYTIV